MSLSVTLHRRTATTLSTVTTRHGEAHDVEQVEAMHARCSETSLYRRFHAPLPRVSTRQVRQMVSPTDGWSLVAECEGRVIGFACAAAVSTYEVEVGLLVEDAHQHKGLGTRMLHEVARETAERGYRTLQLLTQAENDRVLATVQKAGLIGRVSWNDDLLCVSMPVHRLVPSELPRPA